jgi:hypothetical protein
LQAGAAWACCGAGSLLPDGAAVNSYRVAGRSTAVLSGLQARVAGAVAFGPPHPIAHAKQQGAGAAAAPAAFTARYEVCWQVKTPLEIRVVSSSEGAAQARRHARLSQSDGISTMSLCSFSQRAEGLSQAADAFDSCQRTLRFVQQHMPGELASSASCLMHVEAEGA